MLVLQRCKLLSRQQQPLLRQPAAAHLHTWPTAAQWWSKAHLVVGWVLVLASELVWVWELVQVLVWELV